MSTATKKPQSKNYSGERQKHYLTEYIITTNEYVNLLKLNNKYCYCEPCFKASNSEKVKLVNRKKLVKNYLKVCINFIYKVSREEQAKNILNNEEQLAKKLHLDFQESSDEDIIKTIAQNTIVTEKNKTKIDYFLARILTVLEQSAINISRHRKKYEDIMQIIEEMFEEINSLNIKVIGLVTDNNAAYAVSW
ncbi:7636_t:CDS:2 [Scutellospora calospora]|uniref:7636_t:CDS:1 n=1 Tax=Scutellospora calospora TaxID=85575 RepID=A0ACA9JUG7_9GLOM|nr:7636_t:CDS:2 [Scutellospora calospora]